MPGTRLPTSGFSLPSPRRRPSACSTRTGPSSSRTRRRSLAPGAGQGPEGLCGRARRGARRARRPRRRGGGLTRRATARAGARATEGSRLRHRPRAVVHDDGRGAACTGRRRGGRRRGAEARAAGFDWEAARSFAAENTTLRVGDLLVAPVAVVVEMQPGARHDRGRGSRARSSSRWTAGRRGASVNHTFRRLDGLPPYVFADDPRADARAAPRRARTWSTSASATPTSPRPRSPSRSSRRRPPSRTTTATPRQGHPQAPRGVRRPLRAGSGSRSIPRPRSSRRWARRRGWCT